MIQVQSDLGFARPRNARANRVGYADLHMHSTLSDGALPVDALLKMAERKGLSCISITDHDNVDSYALGKKLADDLGIELIPGVELSTVWQGKDVHILGYFFDSTNLALNMELEEQAKLRHQRVRAIIKKLNALGVELTYEKVLTYCKGRVIGRPHIAMAMVAEEYVSNFNEAFNKFLADDGQAFVEKKGLSPQQAIRLVENAGGITVLAHPFKTNVDDLIAPLAEWGLKGIEVYSPAQKGTAGRRYREIARKLDLVGAGGSDFHTEGSAHGMGAMKMPYAVVNQLLERRDRARAERY